MFSLNSAHIYFNEQNTPVSQQFDDVYFSNQDGLLEAEYVFLQGNQLWQRWQDCQNSDFVIAETGFGTGLNFFATVQLFHQFLQQFPQNKLKRLFFLSFEKYPLEKQALAQIHQLYPQFNSLSEQLIQNWHPSISGCQRIHFSAITLDVWFGDVAQQLPALGDYMQHKVDAWFLDGFAPSKNPEMWQQSLYDNMALFSQSNATFATFTAASAVRKGLQQAGFKVEKRKGFGKKRECIAGQLDIYIEDKIQTPWYLPQAASQREDVAIVGGGIASLFTALSLMERGSKVTIYCEDEAPALNASGNQQGAIYPQLSDDDHRNIRFYIHAFYYGLQRIAQLEKQVTFAHQLCGVALCAYNQRSALKINKITAFHWPQELYYPLEAQQLEKKVGLPLNCAGAFIPLGGWLAPRQFVQNTFAFLQQRGLEMKTKQQIMHLEQQAEGWLLYNQQQQLFQHSVVVLANGHQLTQFAQTQELPLYPVRGQVSHIPTSENLSQLKTVLCYDGYLTPVDNDKAQHCIGASHKRDHSERDFSEAEQQENQTKIQQNIAQKWTQDVDTSGNEGRVGVRCSVRDRIPVLGNVSNFAQQREEYNNIFNLRRRKQFIPNAAYYPNLYLVGALGSRGLTSAPILGETLASLIYDEPLPLAQDIMHQLSPNRSWMRKLLKGTRL